MDSYNRNEPNQNDTAPPIYDPYNQNNIGMPPNTHPLRASYQSINATPAQLQYVTSMPPAGSVIQGKPGYVYPIMADGEPAPYQGQPISYQGQPMPLQGQPQYAVIQSAPFAQQPFGIQPVYVQQAQFGVPSQPSHDMKDTYQNAPPIATVDAGNPASAMRKKYAGIVMCLIFLVGVTMMILYLPQSSSGSSYPGNSTSTTSSCTSRTFSACKKTPRPSYCC